MCFLSSNPYWFLDGQLGRKRYLGNFNFGFLLDECTLHFIFLLAPLESSLFKRYEAIFNVALKLVIRDCIGLLCDWFRKLVSLFQPIRYKTKNPHHLVAHVLLRFRQFGWFYLGFSLAHKGILFSFDWRLWLHILHWLWFLTFNRKALMALSITLQLSIHKCKWVEGRLWIFI